MGERYDRIRDLAKKNGTNVTALERELGFAKGSISKIDKNMPSTERVQKIADRLNTTVGYIMGGTDDFVYYKSDGAHEAAEKAFAENLTLRLLFDAMKDSDEKQLEEVYNYLLYLKGKENK